MVKTMKKIFLSAAIVCAVTLVACCGSKGSTVKMGSLSDDLDSLSYSLGANVAYAMNYQLNDVPFDYDRMAKGIEEGAFGKAKMDVEAAQNLVREYLMTKYGPRAQALAVQRAAADSVRMAAGDSTKVEYPADPSLFATDGERDSISYAFGADIGNNIKEMSMPVQLVWLIEAMKNVRENNTKLTEDDVNNYLQYYFMVKRPAENAEASAKWLEKIEKKSGVKKTESGLLYKVTKEGDNTVIATDDRDQVKVHYKGMTREGKVFDASRFADKPEQAQKYFKEMDPEGYDKDEPAEFPLNRVIKGWTEGMKLVGKGGKITLWVPSELAYGARGQGRDIGQNEALCFEVEIIDVIPYVEPTPAPATDSLQIETTPIEVK